MVGQPAPVSRLCLDLRSGLVVRARNPVLLDDEPTVVAARRELGKETVEVDVPRAELEEDAPAPRLVPRAGGAENVQADVLQVDVLDAVAPVPKGSDRLPAGRPQMSRVEQERNIGAVEEALDLGRRLHAGAHVVVEDGL